MRPERESRFILAAVQARAKMHEFRAAEEDYVPFRRAPETLFPLAVGILHDAARAHRLSIHQPGGRSRRPPCLGRRRRLDWDNGAVLGIVL